MQINLLLLIVRPSIINPVMHFSTQSLIGEMKCPTNIPLPYAFHSNSSIVDATHAPTNHQMKWSTSYHHVTVLVHRSWPHLLFTVAFVHRLQVLLKASLPHGPSLQSLQLALHACNRSIKPSLVLIFSTLVTWLNVMSHMQWAPSSHVWALQQIQAIFTVMAWVAHTSVPMG